MSPVSALTRSVPLHHPPLVSQVNIFKHSRGVMHSALKPKTNEISKGRTHSTLHFGKDVHWFVVCQAIDNGSCFHRNVFF